LRFKGKRNEEGKEVGTEGLTREEARKIVDKFGEGPYKLELGSGKSIKEGFIGIDNSEFVTPDIKLNLEDAILPFDDNSVDEVYTAHTLEHIHNLIPLMNEVHRVLRPHGTFDIYVPYVGALLAFQDPTHVRFFTAETFNYFCGSEFLWQHCGSTYGIIPFNYVNTQINNNLEIHCKLRK
jgi:SAM-dependent methyltransferase